MKNKTEKCSKAKPFPLFSSTNGKYFIFFVPIHCVPINWKSFLNLALCVTSDSIK